MRAQTYDCTHCGYILSAAAYRAAYNDSLCPRCKVEKLSYFRPCAIEPAPKHPPEDKSSRQQAAEYLLDQIHYIKRLREDGKTIRELSKVYGVTYYQMREFLLDYGVHVPYVDVDLPRVTETDLHRGRILLDGTTYLMIKKGSQPYVLMSVPEYKKLIGE